MNKEISAHSSNQFRGHMQLSNIELHTLDYEDDKYLTVLNIQAIAVIEHECMTFPNVSIFNLQY